MDEGHKVMFLPKFHCELNPTEWVWGQAKCYSRQYTNYTLARLHNIINPQCACEARVTVVVV